MTPIEETPKPTLPMLELEIKFYLQKTAENVVEIGKRLIMAKEMVEHGEWQNWLEKIFNLHIVAQKILWTLLTDFQMLQRCNI